MLTVRRIWKRITATTDDEECNFRFACGIEISMKKNYNCCWICFMTGEISPSLCIAVCSIGSSGNNLFYTSTENSHRSMLCTLLCFLLNSFPSCSSPSYISFSLQWSEEFTVLYHPTKLKRKRKHFHIYN